MSSFYESFLNGYNREKTASEQVAADGLSKFSPEELEKLAGEISETFASGRLSKVAEEEEEKDEDKEAESEEEKDEDKEAESEEEEDKEAESEEEKDEDKEAESEEEEEDKEAESEEEEEDKEAESEEEEEDKEAESEEEEYEEEDKEAAYSDAELEKMAFELSEQKLAENGFGVVDYVYEKLANEEISYFVTENAEKLAFLTDQPVLKVANDIVNSILEKIN